MSDTLECNYHVLLGIRRRARERGQKVRLRAAPVKKFGWSEGVSVYVDGRKVAWFMKLTTQCAC